MQGLDTLVFTMSDSKTSYSLVSDGAEAVLISKKFFLQHLPDKLQKKLRVTVNIKLYIRLNTILILILTQFFNMFQLQPYPEIENLQNKLQSKTNWDAYKTMMLNDHVLLTKYQHDTLHI